MFSAATSGDRAARVREWLATDPSPERMAEVFKAKAAGLWAFQMPVSRGGLGQNHVGMAVLYEEAARSPFGPVVFNVAPPDDGNMQVLNARYHEQEAFIVAQARSRPTMS